MCRPQLGISMVVMLFVFSISVSTAVAGDALLPQVVYQFEIYELENIEEYELILHAITLRRNQSRELGFAFSLDGGALDFFSPAPTQFTALDTIEKKIRMATPGLVVVLGHTSTLRIVEERLVVEVYSEETPFQLSGMEISVGPMQITREGAIFSAYDIKTFDSENTLHTEVWNRAGEQIPLATVELEGERFLAVFVTASLAGNLDGPSRSVASLGGLGDLLWANSPSNLDWESTFWIVLPLNPIELPEGGFLIQLGSRFYANAEYQRLASYSYLGLGAAIMEGGPSIDVRWIYTQEHYFLALGVADCVEAVPGVLLSAGFLPLVFELGNDDLQSPHWWIQVEATRKALRASIRYQSGGRDNDVLKTELGYEFAKHTEVFARVSHSRDNTRLGLGMSLMF